MSSWDEEDRVEKVQSVREKEQPAGFLAPDEEPVLRPQFQRAHRVLGNVVVELRAALDGIRQQHPLVEGM